MTTAAKLALALASLSLPASAGVGTSSFTALASVNTNCMIVTTPVAFGAYDPIGANSTTSLTATGSLTVTCVKGTAPTIALGLGLNASGALRRMSAGPGEFLSYELYQPPGTAAGLPCSFPGTTVWGSSGGNLFSAGAAPSKAARSYQVCGTVPAGQDPSIGSYTDTVVATVNF